jgi:hypothetical protein
MKDKALAAINQLEELIKIFGSPNRGAHEQFKRLLFTLKGVGPLSSYYNEKLNKLSYWGEIGFSTRKFNSYNGGVEQVRVWALGACGIVRSLLEEHFATKSRTDA